MLAKNMAYQSHATYSTDPLLSTFVITATPTIRKLLLAILAVSNNIVVGVRGQARRDPESPPVIDRRFTHVVHMVIQITTLIRRAT